jgi:hypothetical protein
VSFVKRFLLSMLAGAVIGASVVPPLAAQRPQVTTLVTILTAPDTETQFMAMILTFKSLRQGVRARMMLCAAAGDLALREPPDWATVPQKPFGLSPRDMLQKIMEANVPVQVCAIYLPSRNLTPDALLPGITAAKPDDVADHLISNDTRILSF